MKIIIKILFFLFFVRHTHAQLTYEVEYGIDKVFIGNNHPIYWKASDASSITLKCIYNLKEINVGVNITGAKYQLSRPNYFYDMQYNLYGFLIAKPIELNDKFNAEFQLLQYIRIFDIEFYSASLIVDGYNIGIALSTRLEYKLTKKIFVNFGYSFQNDLVRGAINSDEITDKYRFIKMEVNSFLIGVSFKF